MDSVSFKINGKSHSVGCETSSDLSLLEYLRVRCELRGTKYMCREGGCGACVVAAATPGAKIGAVNSCLVSVTSCHDWEITTIEGIGNRLQGYHPIQKTLGKLHGSQCGYCSPGWVMAMYR
ncbi:probable aldehyde oxidase 4 [Leguminivora glycinivorella]|uniref:probable aldehyde oxidase 4 n=1 Tax=Leguminivora glycinivorella TaxID=1035111 RepID=UPI00200BAF4E|nr:probable aldehyde oxidase 4 [Leguminivora glycinivorella]